MTAQVNAADPPARCCDQYGIGDHDSTEHEEVCGVTYDHDTVDIYRGYDGTQWNCRRCGAEGWEAEGDES